MARSFTAASSQYLEAATAPVTGVPFSMACWFQSTNITTNYALMSLGVSTGNSRAMLLSSGAVANDPIQAFSSITTGSSSSASTSTGFTANTWHHAAGVFASSASRAAYLDGGGKGTESTSRVLGTPDRMTLGARLSSGTPGLFLDGKLGEAAIWDVALTDAEVAILALGYSPLVVRPSALVSYWDLIGRYSPELDRRGAAPLTVTGAVVADHPRIIYPTRARVMVPTLVSAGGVTLAHLEHAVGRGAFRGIGRGMR